MREQFERTGLLQTLGDDAVLSATEQAYGSCLLAEQRGRGWLEGKAGPTDEG